jgi:hypothetical protein
VDLEGRYLLIHSYTSKSIYSVDLMQQPLVPTIVLTAQAMPPLETATSLELYDHPVDGRVCVLTHGRHGLMLAGVPPIVLKDAENDGVFETHVAMAPLDYVDSYMDSLLDPTLFGFGLNDLLDD